MTAHEFDPDRFLDERLKEYLLPNPFIFLPFNAGPRICLGQQVGFYLKLPLFLSLSSSGLSVLFSMRGARSILVRYHLRALPHGPELSLPLLRFPPFLLTRYILTRAVRIQPNVVHGHPPTAIFLLIHTRHGRLPAFCAPARGVG
jgi:hypothetical protein